MKYILLFTLIISLNAFGQEHELTKDSRSSRLINLMIERGNMDSTDVQFVSDRKLLFKLQNKECNIDGYDVKIFDILSTNEKVEVYIKISDFLSSDHNIEYLDDDKYYVGRIDNQRAYGNQNTMPKKEISELKIIIDGVQLEIPKLVYSNIFYPMLCASNEYFMRDVEVYNSISGKYLYVYFYGGPSEIPYFGKLVFDKEKYVTKIFADYYELGTSGSFRKDFVGF